MLGAFIRHGLSQSEAEANGILQLFVKSPFRFFLPLRTLNFFSQCSWIGPGRHHTPSRRSLYLHSAGRALSPPL